jgi:hypothetical protein
MKYQLVLQWPASSIKGYDVLIEIEDVLIKNLTKPVKVDGHDAGSGEVNIFVHTDDPKRTFEEVRAILGSRDFWVDGCAAYREAAKSEYIILWPKDLTEFTVV